MANYIESNEVARPYRKTKRRGKQPDKLCVVPFFLEENNITRINKNMCAKSEIERLKSDGFGPPPDEFVNTDGKVEFQFSLSVEEFKNKLVEIYPKLDDMPFLLMKANKSNILERLNIAPSYYNPEEIYYSNLGQGKLYIRRVNDTEVNSDGKSLHYNPYSWNKVANMLYLESPAGVGFSYSEDQKYATDDDTVSMDNFVALLDFFEKFPQFKKNLFYVTGESYGGIYVPTLSLRILQGNSTINMKGFAVGNGLSSNELNMNSLVYFAYYHGLLGDELWSQLLKYCCKDTLKCSFYNSTDLNCKPLLTKVQYIVYNIGLNVYGLYENCSGLKSGDVRLLYALSNSFKLPNKMTKKVKLGLNVPCINSTADTVYLNRAIVRDALHIPEGVQNWTVCSGIVNIEYKRLYETMFPIYEKLLQHYRAMVYNGDTDMACNFLGDQLFVDSLGLKTVKERRPWKNRHQVAGFVKDFENLSFVTVKGAGHMVPEDRPPEAFQMFSSFLANQPL